MPELNETNVSEELDNIVYDSPVNPAYRERMGYYALNTDYMEAYRKGVAPQALTPSVGFLHNSYLTGPKAFARGAVSIPFKLATTAESFIAGGAALYSDYLDSNFKSSTIEDYKERYVSGEWTKEQYDTALSDFKKSNEEAFKRKLEVERRQTLHSLQKINYLQYKLQEYANLNPKKGEWKWLSDMMESAPTTLSAIGIAYLAKGNKAAQYAFLTATQAGDVVQKELEYGEDLRAALITGTTTAGASSLLDVIGLEFMGQVWNAPARNFATKCGLYNKLLNWVAGNPARQSTFGKLGFVFRAGIASATEEGITETAQGIIEENLPRFLGQGNKFNSWSEEILNYAYQGWIGAISGGLFGAGGSAVTHAHIHNSITSWAKKNNMSEEEGKSLADFLTPVVAEHAEKVKQEAIKEINSVDVSKEGIDKTVKILEGGLTSNEKGYVRENLLQTLNKKNPNNKAANAIAATILTEAASIEAGLTDGNIDKAASQYNVEIKNDEESIGVSDKYYNATVRKNGRTRIEGAVKKDVASHIIELLNNGNPDTIIHETGHLLLKSITNALNKTGQDAFKHSLVNTVVDLIGVPEGANNEFSDAQHEAFANALQEYAREGVAPNPQLAEVFAINKRIMDSIYKTAAKEEVLTKKGRENFQKIFAFEEASLPNVDLTEENVKVLQETISQIRNGKTPSIKNLKVLAEVIKLKRARAPIPTGYSLSEYMADNPEYSQTNDVRKKRKMLKDAQFEGADDKQAFPDDRAYIAEVERNPSNVFSVPDETTKVRQAYIDKYNAYKELADKILPKGSKELLDLERAIYKVLSSGDLVVTDKNFLQDVSDTMKSLVGKLREYKKTEREEAQKEGRDLVNQVKRLLPTMQLTGIKIEGIEKMLDDFTEQINEGNVDKINEYNRMLRDRLEYIGNEILEKYIDSQYFAEQQGVTPPVANPIKVKADIIAIVSKFIAEGHKIRKNSQVIREIRRALRDHKIPGDIVDKMVNKLVSNSVSLVGEVSRENFVKDLVDSVNKEYLKKMSAKIESEWAKLKEQAKKKNLSYKDQLFVKWLQDNIVNYKGEGKVTGKGTSHLSTALPLYYQTIDVENAVLGQDPTLPEGKQDIKMNDEQKAFVNTMMNFMLAKDTNADFTPNQAFEMFKAINKFSYLTADYVQRQEEAKKEKLNSTIKKAIESVSGRKDIPIWNIAEKLFFAEGLSGLRSNLIKVFGQDFADIFDVIVEERNADIVKDRIYTDVDNFVSDITKGKAISYYKRLDTQKPFENAKEGTVEYELKDYNRGQLLNIWLLSKNEIGRKWIKNNFEGNADKVVSTIDKKLSKIDKAVGEHLMTLLKALYPDLNKVYFELNGSPMGIQASYWPIVTEQVTDNAKVVTDLNAFEVLPKERKTEKFQLQRVGPASVEPGEVKRMAVFENPVETFKRYVKKATNYVYVVPKLNTLSQMLNSNTVESKLLATTIKERFGESTLKALRNDVRFLMGFNKNRSVSELEKMFNEVLSNYVVAKLGLKAMVGIKQIPSAINFMSLMPPGAFATYIQKSVSEPKKVWKYMMKHEAVRDRFAGQELPMFFADNQSLIMDTMIGNYEPLRKAIGEKKLAQVSSWLSQAKNKAMINVRLGDITAVIYGGYAYEMYLRDKMKADPNFNDWSEAEKETYIEQRLIEAIETTQQSGLGSTKGGWHQDTGGLGSIFARSMFMFSSFNTQCVRKVREAAYEYRNGKISREEFFKNAIIYLGIQPMMYAVLSSPAMFLAIIGGMLGMRDDDEWKDQLYLALLRPYIDNVASAGGNLGNIITFVSDTLAELVGQETYGADLNMTPGVFTDFKKALGSLKKIKKGDAGFEEYLSVPLVTMESTTGIPLQTIKNMLKGVVQSGTGLADKDQINNLIYGFANMIGMSERQLKKFLKD